MKVEMWSLAEHGQRVREWSSLRGQACVPEIYPDTGLVVDDCASAFLFLTNSRVAYIDGLSSDPRVSRHRVGRAVDTLVRSLTTMATVHGRTVVLLTTGLKGASKRHAERLGFTPIAEQQTTFIRVER